MICKADAKIKRKISGKGGGAKNVRGVAVCVADGGILRMILHKLNLFFT